MGNDSKRNQLGAELEDALRQEDIVAQRFADRDYDLLPEFNWDVRSFDHQAAVHLVDQIVDVLHVVVVAKKKGFLSREPAEIHYRAKCLVECPAYVLEGRGRDDGPFSISFIANEGMRWRSDMGEGFENALSDSLNMDSGLEYVILHKGHSNVNAWLEEFAARNYMAINTSKVYSRSRDTADCVPVSNEIIKAINSLGA